MNELQIAVDMLMTSLQDGGGDAVRSLVKGGVIKGAEKASQLWKSIFSKNAEVPLLAHQVAEESPEDSTSKQEELRALVEQVLNQHPELLQLTTVENVDIKGGIHAENGGIAIGVMTGGEAKTENKG